MSVEILSNIGLLKNSEPYIVQVDGNQQTIFITAINQKTGELISRFPLNGVQMLLDYIPLIFDKKLKCVYSTLCGIHDPKFPNEVELYKAINGGLAQLNIPIYYYTKNNFIFTMCLVAANISVEIGETIFIILTQNEILQYASLTFTSNGYKLNEDRIIPILHHINPDVYRQTVLGSSNPSKIIMSPMSFDTFIPDYVKNAFNSSKTVIVDRQPYINRSIMVTYKWFKEKAFVKYISLPTCQSDCFFGFKYGSTNHQLITAKNGDDLPFTKTIEIPRSSFVFYI
uniref:Uncharacterized protein n=1 Tax=Panagrolaimus sp. ES5 TaxID=591445 RepID=A0AC34G8R2_9BILA